jgi:hypothetical protein
MNRRWTPMNADPLEKETASARSHTKQTVTNNAQTPEVQVLLFPALIGVHRRPSAVPEALGRWFLLSEIRETGYEFPENGNSNPDPAFHIVCGSHFSGPLAVQKPH